MRRSAKRDIANRPAVETDFGKLKAGVLNVVPPQRAGDIARRAECCPRADAGAVELLTYESRAQQQIHVIGDAAAIPDAAPKSGHIANQTAELCAAAVMALLKERP